MKIKIDKRSAYTETHAMMLLRSLYKKPKGRGALTKELSLRESTVRTMLRVLNLEKLVKPTTFGQALTKKGRELTDTVNRRISYPVELSIRTFTKSENNVAYLIKEPKIITSGVKERDSAVKMGADGIIVFIQKKSLELIGAGKTKIKFPKIIKEVLNPEKNDIIIITFAPKRSASELAGLAVALELIEFDL